MRYTSKWLIAMEHDQSYRKEKSSDLIVCVRKDFLLWKGMKAKPNKPTKDSSDCETSDPTHPTSALLEEVQVSWGMEEKWVGDFPGSPVIKTLLFHCRGTNSIPSQQTKIPLALRYEQQQQQKRKVSGWGGKAWNTLPGCQNVIF